MCNRLIHKKSLLIGVAFFSLIGSVNLWAVDEPPTDRCMGYGNLQSILLNDWEEGLGTWSADTHDVANPTAFATPDWTSVGSLPDGKSGRAAFVANLDLDCGLSDQSGALTLDSPAVQIPNNAGVPRISFEHWFDTELEYDGGNIKISVNGGAFNIIPASAFEYGEHYVTLAPAFDGAGFEDNTNPLAGEEAFTGTANGNPSGSWTDVRINLLGIAAAGDTIKLRFDFGIDVCLGTVGWYVDDVEIYSCSAELPPSDCGNGVLDSGEKCDDGNDFIGDGCSNTCQVENGWECSVPGSPGNIPDPGFEAGTPNPFWTEVSNNPIGTPICEVAVCGQAGGTGPSEGMFWVNLGSITTYQEGSVSQSVVIPSSVSTLTFELEIPSCDSAADYMELLIDDRPQLRITGSSPLCGITGYMTQTADISAYADDTAHDIEFHSETFSNNGGLSSFFIDAISMPGNPSICTTATGPSLTLIKKVINNDGGFAGPASWTLSATGPTGFSGPGPNVVSGEGFQAGTYDLSESGGPPGYMASDWVCVGGTQNDEDTVTLGQSESAICTITNDDFDPGFQINAGHSGAWFNPDTSGQGVLVDISPEDRYMFLAWFTYTDANSGSPLEQRWLTAQGSYSGLIAQLPLYETLGGKFDDPQKVSTKLVGEVILEFDDCEKARMSYLFDSEELQGEFPLVRVIPGSGDVCAAQSGNSLQAVDINAGMDGAWYDLNTSGQGFLMDSHPNPAGGNFIFVAWFTYGEDTASGQRWLTAQGGFEGPTAVIDVYESTGGSFDDPKPVTTVLVGEMSIDFTDCSNALLTYSLTSDQLEGEIDVSRLLAGASALCEEISGAD